MPALRDRLRSALTDALKTRDRVAANAVRSALAAIDNAQAVDSADRAGAIELSPVGLAAAEAVRRELTEEQIARIVRTEIDEREHAASDYEARGAADRAAILRAEADVLNRLCAG